MDKAKQLLTWTDIRNAVDVFFVFVTLVAFIASHTVYIIYVNLFYTLYLWFPFYRKYIYAMENKINLLGRFL